MRSIHPVEHGDRLDCGRMFLYLQAREEAATVQHLPLVHRRTERRLRLAVSAACYRPRQLVLQGLRCRLGVYSVRVMGGDILPNCSCYLGWIDIQTKDARNVRRDIRWCYSLYPTFRLQRKGSTVRVIGAGGSAHSIRVFANYEIV